METGSRHRHIRAFRILALALIFSGALNIGLIAAFIASSAKEKDRAFSYSAPHRSKALEEEVGNKKQLMAYAKLSFRQLASLLTNTEEAEEGYRKRDLALSALVSFHHFDIDRALGGVPLQRRIAKWEAEGGALIAVEMFPMLAADQFQAIIRFAYLEKWPLTARGLFALLQKSARPRDSSLEQAFALTTEFSALQALFQKTELLSAQNALIDLACEGSWAMLESLVREQAQMLDLSDERRRQVLLSYLAVHSESAARLLLKADFSFVLKRLDDRGILDLLSDHKEFGEPMQKFCVELLKSNRSDEVWLKSAERLYQAASESIPQPFDRAAALNRFGGIAMHAEIVPPRQEASSASAALRSHGKERPREHVVKDGESLWKISRQYRIKIDDLIALNGLEKDKIRPGMILHIPAQDR